MRLDWVDRARCREIDPELFFPVGSTGPAADQAQEARTVCQMCTVRSECLEWALETGQDSGVWGGIAEEERRSMRRARRKAARLATIAG